MSVAPILIVVLSYNIWNNTLHWQYPSPTVAPRQLNSSQLWSWISLNVSISHLLHCSVYYLSSQGGSFDPRTSFPGAPISLSHPALLSQACDRGSWTNTQRHTGTTVNPCLLCKLRSHVVTSASYVVWVWSPLSVNTRCSCHHQPREKCIRRSGLKAVCVDFRGEMERLGESQCQHCKITKVHTMTFDTRFAIQTNHNSILCC